MGCFQFSIFAFLPLEKSPTEAVILFLFFSTKALIAVKFFQKQSAGRFAFVGLSARKVKQVASAAGNLVLVAKSARVKTIGSHRMSELKKEEARSRANFKLLVKNDNKRF